MTKLPIDSWRVAPRFDLGSYELNTVCPVTGETVGLEDHHIWRRSFTALGKENEKLFWVEALEGDRTHIYPNRVALSPMVHERLTTNRAHLKFVNDVLVYVESGEEKTLDLHFKLMEAGEKISKPRRKNQKVEKAREKTTYTIRKPRDEEMVLPELEEAIREKYADQMGWDEDVPAYFVWALAGAIALQQ